MRPRSSRLALIGTAYVALAAGGFALFVGHTAFGWGGRPSTVYDFWLYNGLILSAAVGVAARAVLVRRERAAWTVMTIGLASWAAGDLIYTFGYGDAPPYPSLADAAYLGFYPLAYVALFLLVRARVSRPNFSVWLDGLAAALAAAAVGAALLVDLVLETTGGSLPVVATSLAYPLADVVLLALVVAVLSLVRWRPDRAWISLGAALVATAVADSIYLYQSAQSSYVSGNLVDSLWPASTFLIAVAAWLPARRAADVELSGRPLLATPAIAGVTGLALLVYDHFELQNVLALSLSAAAVLAVFVRTALTFRENTRVLSESREQAVTDSLTGLRNRRKLLADLARACADPDGAPFVLVVFDLDGFKRYNDTYGHLAGDALLRRLGVKLEEAVSGCGRSYRLGGDEFCVLADASGPEADPVVGAAAEALSEAGDGFSVTSSFGVVSIPAEAHDPRSALRIADQRLYAQKHARGLGRARPHEVLLQALFEREPDLRSHVEGVTELSLVVGARLGLRQDDLEELRLAAELHDVGKLAIPDTILRKPGSLEPSEWEFVRRHTLIGQRILDAAPALFEVGKIVRSTHERWDGTGYADGLAAGEIPLAARIIAVCDAYVAMTSDRPYRAARAPEEAIEELRRCAGRQFDPDVVELFCVVAAERAAVQAA